MKTIKNKIKPLIKKPVRLQIYFPSADDMAYKDISKIVEVTGKSFSEVGMQALMVGLLDIGDVLLENQSNLNRAVAAAVKKQQKRRGKKNATTN